jgi:hypothetical protein
VSLISGVNNFEVMDGYMFATKVDYIILCVYFTQSNYSALILSFSLSFSKSLNNFCISFKPKNSRTSDGLTLMVSVNRGPFTAAQIPSQLPSLVCLFPVLLFITLLYGYHMFIIYIIGYRYLIANTFNQCTRMTCTTKVL